MANEFDEYVEKTQGHSDGEYVKVEGLELK